jgi:two-component system, chemotaxis family, protein-glutamate methylesterase/glutaminase
VFVVWHLPAGLGFTILPTVLTKAGGPRARLAVGRMPIEPGTITVAPPDHHLLLERGFVRVTKGPKENRFRPAIDPLFRSAAYVYGPRVIGVVLTGALDDGTAGLWTIKLRGGVAVVQDPAEALHPSMPMNALQNVAVDHSLPLAQIGPLLDRLVREEAPSTPEVPMDEKGKTEAEVRIAEEAPGLEENIFQYGELSPFTCPECHGVLTTLRDGKLMRFRCHTGHAYSSGTLLDEVCEQVEMRLWDAVRALDETVMLLNRLGEEQARLGDAAAAEHFFAKARQALERTKHIRAAALDNERLSAEALKQAEA